MTLKDKIIVYIYNKTNQLEIDKSSMNDSRRYKPMDSLDMYELMREDIRQQCWNEFIDDIYNIVITDYSKSATYTK